MCACMYMYIYISPQRNSSPPVKQCTANNAKSHHPLTKAQPSPEQRPALLQLPQLYSLLHDVRYYGMISSVILASCPCSAFPMQCCSPNAQCTVMSVDLPYQKGRASPRHAPMTQQQQNIRILFTL